jgi:Ricin-type beta-trefoil lectin domain-like
MANYAYLKSKLNGNVIDSQQASTKPGAGLDAYPQRAPNDNQLWMLVPDPTGSGFYFIRSKLNGNVIDIEQASTQAGALLDAYPQKTSDYDNQLWKIVADASSGYSFIQSKLNGNVIDIVEASTKPGALLDTWPQKATGNDNQLWQLIPENPLFPALPLIGYFWIQSKLNDNVIDILGGSTKPGASLDAWPKQENENQLWSFSLDPAGSGYFFISSKLNFNVIDIEQASTQPGALLDAYPPKSTGNDNQLWKFVPDGSSGWGFLESKLNGNVIDIQQASTQPGALLDAYPRKSSGNDNQLWMPVGAMFPELPTSLTWSNLGTGSGTTSSGATECSYTLNLTIQQDGTCRFWGKYTNRGDVPLITAASQTFGVAIVVFDLEGNGYSFAVGGQVPSAPQPGSTYSWDQTQTSAEIANNWNSIATRNYADYEYHNQASLGDILSEIEAAINAIAQTVQAVAAAVKAIMAIGAG